MKSLKCKRTLCYRHACNTMHRNVIKKSEWSVKRPWKVTSIRGKAARISSLKSRNSSTNTAKLPTVNRYQYMRIRARKNQQSNRLEMGSLLMQELVVRASKVSVRFAAWLNFRKPRLSVSGWESKSRLRDTRRPNACTKKDTGSNLPSKFSNPASILTKKSTLLETMKKLNSIRSRGWRPMLRGVLTHANWCKNFNNHLIRKRSHQWLLKRIKFLAGRKCLCLAMRTPTIEQALRPICSKTRTVYNSSNPLNSQLSIQCLMTTM